MFCRNCGAQLAADARFCPNCGTGTAATTTAGGAAMAPAFAGSVTRDRPEMLQPLPASIELCSVWRRSADTC